ncbi:MAG: hypothetical protein JW778_05765 [Candidatus Altiarchaeota archaeon]|nr:hypothetical protein [Candidatus Altiarchaeota archaeon]
MIKISVRYDSIEANKFNEPQGYITVNNNSTITDVERVEGRLSIGFTFKSKYEPDIGEVKITGKTIVEDSEEKMEKAVKEWDKSGQKNLPLDMAEEIHNFIIFNCVTETVILAREIQLPSPIPMPKVAMKDKNKEKEDTGNYIR